MNVKKLFGVILAGVIVLTFGLTGCTAADLKQFQGMLKDIDSLSGNVTVTLNDGTTATFNLSEIDVQALKNTLGDISLEAGDNVTLKQDRNGKVKAMEVCFARAEGTIKSVDAGNITIATKDNHDITLIITQNTTIIQKTAGTVNAVSLQVGHRVEAKYDAATLQALQIKVDFLKVSNQYIQLEGTIQSVGTDNTTITVTSKKQGDITLTVTPATLISLNSQGMVSFSSLKAGQKVTIKYDSTNMQAAKIIIQDGGKVKNQNQVNKTAVKTSHPEKDQ